MHLITVLARDSRKDNALAERGCFRGMVATRLSQEVYCFPSLLFQNLGIFTRSSLSLPPGNSYRSFETHLKYQYSWKSFFIPQVASTLLCQSIYPIISQLLVCTFL